MIYIYFLYGLSFFTMGVVIALEVGRCSDGRLRYALRFLAVFGLLHSVHEWVVMMEDLHVFTIQQEMFVPWIMLRTGILAASFLPLSTFGVFLLAPNREKRRLALMVPLTMGTIWAFGVLYFENQYTFVTGLAAVVENWTRYEMAIPASLLACYGLIFQQREFRRVGMAQFGRDSLYAAIAFAWYGLVGQLFTQPSPLPPSTFLNTVLFQRVFGFPVELMRAIAAGLAAVFVIRFLRSFEVEIQRKLNELQAAQLDEAQRREALRGELLRRVVAAQESERQRIARELHDETGQALTALGLGLRGVTNQYRQDPEKAASNLRQLERLVGRSMDELQRIIGDLRPSHLDDLGLAAALRWYCNDVQNHAGLPIALEMSGEAVDIPAEVKTAIFRIAQEALTNVVRHSEARQAHLSLTFLSDAVRLCVDDNGKGFDFQKMNQAGRPAWGLLGMEERASLLDGKLEIESQPGNGTHITVVIPYKFQTMEA